MGTYITNVIAGLYQPFAYESITVADTAIGCTAATIKPGGTGNSSREATKAVITVETAQIRYRYDGTDPTSIEGHILNNNDALVLIGYDAISKFRTIRTGVTSGVIKVTYER